MDKYSTLDSLKGYLKIPADDTTDDGYLNIALDAASRAIDRATNRDFTIRSGSASARVFTAHYDAERRAYVVPIDDLTTTTGLEVKVDVDGDWSYAYTVTETPQTFPFNAAAKDMPWTELLFREATLPTGLGEVQVTADWGWESTVPYSIEQACLIQASRLFKRRDAPFGVAGSPELGSELRLLARLDPDVEVLVHNYRKWWAAA